MTRKTSDEAQELAERLRELEERTGQFQREAISGARVIEELESTLALEAQARRKLEEVVERQNVELERWRREAEAQASRLEEERRLAAAAERERLKAECAAAMDAAEAVRREGVEALEEARALNKAR